MSLRFVLAFGSVGLLGGALCSCAVPEKDVPAAFENTEETARDTASRLERVDRVLGHSVEGREIRAIDLGPGRSEALLLIATIHGDEPAGTPLLNRLVDELEADPGLCGRHRIVIVPIANPDGFEKGTRTNARRVDLNRNFTAENRRDTDSFGTAYSEPESKALGLLLEEVEPSRVISIHQPLACIDYDGPAKELALALGRTCDLPVRKLGARPGSMGSHVGVDRGIPIITLELPGGAEKLTEGELWRRYRDLLLAFLAY